MVIFLFSYLLLQAARNDYDFIITVLLSFYSHVYGVRIKNLQEELLRVKKKSAAQRKHNITLKGKLATALNEVLAAKNGQPFMSAAYFLGQSDDWIMKHSGNPNTKVYMYIFIVHVFVYLLH